MMTKKGKHRLDILKRMQKGTQFINSYKNLFKNFNGYILYNLEESDLIVDKIRGIVSQKSKKKNEFLDENKNFIESDLLRDVYLNVNEFSLSYVFTENYTYCGIILVKSKEAIENILEITRLADGNTSYLIDYNFKYSFTINYYDYEHNDYPKKFDIQKSI